MGNVRAVVSDVKVPTVTAGAVTDLTADVVSASDYYPGGMVLPGRSFSSNSYRYGFNGKEKDEEGLGGGGSTYDYGFRIYNPQIVRFLSVDPLAPEYPWYTPYQFAGNTPIQAIDLDGLEELHYYYAWNDKSMGYDLVANVVDERKLMRTLTHHYQSRDGSGSWESIVVDEGSYDPKQFGARLLRPIGINIYGAGSLKGWVLGRKADLEDTYGDFDFKDFMETVNVILQSVKTKSQNEIGTSNDDARKKIVEVGADNLNTKNQDLAPDAGLKKPNADASKTKIDTDTLGKDGQWWDSQDADSDGNIGVETKGGERLEYKDKDF